MTVLPGWVSSVFSNLADYFFYRSKVCDRNICYSGLNKKVQTYLHDNLRGNYGTNYFEVIKSFFIITLLFSCVYFFLGCYNIAFGFYTITKLNSDNNMSKPIVLTLRKNKCNIFSFSLNCLLFSLNNMILGGLNHSLHLHNFTTLYLYPPKRFGTIGTGRFLALIQSLVGLLLVFFFISAFLRLNR